MSVSADDLRIHDLLAEIDAGRAVSQRKLARRLGIALGLTNALMRRMIDCGLIGVVRVSPHEIRYEVTAAGRVEMQRTARAYFMKTTEGYAAARERMVARLRQLSSEASGHADRPTRIVVYGTGKMVEIGYLSALDAELAVVGLVDRFGPLNGNGRVLGMTVYGPDALDADALAGRPFDRVVIMPSDDERADSAALAAINLTADRLFWV